LLGNANGNGIDGQAAEDGNRIEGHPFQRLENERNEHDTLAPPDDDGLLRLLSDHVVSRFTRLTGLPSVAALTSSPGGSDTEDPAENPAHPACAEFAHSDYCRESWQLHLAELSKRPETHWHKCERRRLCAVVPVVCQGRCLAACKLVCAGTMAEQLFLNNVEILDVLARDFVTSEAAFLARMLPSHPEAIESKGPLPIHRDVLTHGLCSHPAIVQALQTIEAHISDPKLTVSRVAREVNLHPNYLSGLFVDLVGQSMRDFITNRRVDMAKTLLATTDWQIKRIAHHSGHANARWFGHVFRTTTGVSPAAYRARSRRPSRVA